MVKKSASTAITTGAMDVVAEGVGAEGMTSMCARYRHAPTPHERWTLIAQHRNAYPADMTPESIVQAGMAVLTSLGTLVGVASRKRRLRREIMDNLELIAELEKIAVLRDQTPVIGWLQGKVALDVAKLANVKLDTGKTPIPWGSVATAAILALSFGVWTYWINRDGFVWYSVFPGMVAFLTVISVLGMTTNRQRPPEQSSDHEASSDEPTDEPTGAADATDESLDETR